MPLHALQAETPAACECLVVGDNNSVSVTVVGQQQIQEYIQTTDKHQETTESTESWSVRCWWVCTRGEPHIRGGKRAKALINRLMPTDAETQPE